MNTKRLLPTLVAAVLLPASASLIFYEGFAGYNTSGSPAYLHNQNPTLSPFNAAWVASNNFGTNANAGARLVDGLSFTDHLPSTGSAVRMGRFGGSGGLVLHNVTRAANPALTPASDAYFGSFLISMNENMFNATSNTQMFTQFSFIDNQGGSTRNLQIGVNADKQLTLAAGTGGTMSTTASSTDAVMSGHTAAQLIVFRILDRDNPANSESVEQITAWLNPDFSTDISTWANPLSIEHDLLRTVNGPNLFSGLGLFTQVNGSGHQGNFDEIRFGTTFDAAVIPEPGTLALVGIALGSLLLFRRRR